MSIQGRVLPYPDAGALAQHAAEDFARLAREAVEDRGRFSAALTGGSSPMELYRLLGSEPLAGQIPWQRVHLFWGDERAVPPGHPRSNFGMANRLLVSRVPIPAGNVHRMRGELGAEQGAERYRDELHAFFGDAPRFDLVHLGLGGNGHVASLFPFDLPRLTERERWVMAALNPDNGEPRITLTLAALNAAARLEFLIPGEAKAPMGRAAMSGPLDPFRIPAQLVRPRDGELVWRVLESITVGAPQGAAARG
jgi:6-phosphogluconolactonase